MSRNMVVTKSVPKSFHWKKYCQRQTGFLFCFGALGAFQGKLSPLSSKMTIEACVLIPVCVSGCIYQLDSNWSTVRAIRMLSGRTWQESSQTISVSQQAITPHWSQMAYNVGKDIISETILSCKFAWLHLYITEQYDSPLCLGVWKGRGCPGTTVPVLGAIQVQVYKWYSARPILPILHKGRSHQGWSIYVG